MSLTELEQLRAELDALRQERDAAVARAVKAEAEVARLRELHDPSTLTEAELDACIAHRAVRSARRDAARQRPHWVYLVSVGGVLKLGMSRRPQGRVLALEGHASAEGFRVEKPAVLIQAVQAPDWRTAFDAEAALARLFAPYCARGREWFHDVADVRQKFDQWARYAKAEGHAVMGT